MISRRTTQVDATAGNGRPFVATDTSEAPCPDATDAGLSALQPLRSGALEELDRQVTQRLMGGPAPIWVESVLVGIMPPGQGEITRDDRSQ
jgi:hypothetical protein